MAYFRGSLVLVLVCLIHVHSIPLLQKEGAPYTLSFYINQTNFHFVGSDLSNLYALTNLHVTVFTDKPQQLPTATQALQEQLTSLQFGSQFEKIHEPVTDSGNNPYKLVFQYNKTEGVMTGPKPEKTTILSIKLNMWAKQ